MLRLLEGASKEDLINYVKSGYIIEFIDEDLVVDFAKKCANLVDKDIAIEELCEDKNKLNNVRRSLGLNNLASVGMIIEELKEITK